MGWAGLSPYAGDLYHEVLLHMYYNTYTAYCNEPLPSLKSPLVLSLFQLLIPFGHTAVGLVFVVSW